jgi:hypothetical protein
LRRWAVAVVEPSCRPKEPERAGLSGPLKVLKDRERVVTESHSYVRFDAIDRRRQK